MLILVMFGIDSYAQTPSSSMKQQRKELRMKKKQEKQQALLKSRKFYAYLLKNKAFVLEANQVFGPRGNMLSVSPTTNFFAVRKNKVIFQYGLGAGGRNGVGGMTAEGFIDHYQFESGKSNKKGLTVSGNIQPKNSGNAGYFTLTVMDNGNASLRIIMPYGSNLSMSGRLVALPNASVFKGSTDF